MTRRTYGGVALVAAAAATVAALFLLSRSSTAPEDARPRGSLIDDALVAALEPKLTGWVEEYRKTVPEFSLKTFRKVEEESLLASRHFIPIQHYDLSPSAQQARRQLYEFSPDGTKFVDVYARDELVPAAGGGLEMAQDVDGAVVLVDMPGRTVTQLLFCGPSSCEFHGAAWLSDEAFVVYGWGEDFSKDPSAPFATQPILWHYDLRRMTITTYTGPSRRGEAPHDIFERMLQRRIPALR